MTLQPIFPLSGYAGRLFFERTADTQRAAFKDSPAVVSATDTFREKIGSVTTAQDLVADQELLSVALGAFGLDDDINNPYFIQKILEEGTIAPDALANRLSDSRYADFSKAFDFGDLGLSLTGLSYFADDIIDRYEAKQFEAAVGEQNKDMRLALNLNSALDDVITGNDTNDRQWFGVMGNSLLRSVIETALGFSSSFETLDNDLQLSQFKARSEVTFGTDQLSELAIEENQEKLIRLYMLRSEANTASQKSPAHRSH